MSDKCASCKVDVPPLEGFRAGRYCVVCDKCCAEIDKELDGPLGQAIAKIFGHLRSRPHLTDENRENYA